MIATGRFLVNTHVHAQRHAFKFKERGIKPAFATLAEGMPDVEAYDNSPRLLYDMERYNVDMCVLMTAFAMTDEVDVEIVQAHPNKFVALAGVTQYMKDVRAGKITWSVDGMVAEYDRLLGTGLFVGVGEFIPRDPFRKKPYTWEERFEHICKVMEVVRKHKKVMTYHTGTLSGYGGMRSEIGRWLSSHELANPLLAHDLATEFPDVPIIMEHAGISGWWSEKFIDDTLQAAAAHPNVYLETGHWWADLYERPLRDPNIGAEKLVWGTDWGASVPQQWLPGSHPASYPDQNSSQGLPAHQVDDFGWSLRQLAIAANKYDLPQDDLNLILGGNAVRVYKLEDKVPHKRLFKEYLKQ
jgi:predicted TIM-barrel fold metal-dependent hydrolase